MNHRIGIAHINIWHINTILLFIIHLGGRKAASVCNPLTKKISARERVSLLARLAQFWRRAPKKMPNIIPIHLYSFLLFDFVCFLT
jgi:inactivated superfamily I helicase